MIEVHHLNNSRSQRVLWMLEELRVPYKIVHHLRDTATMLAPETLKAVHPLGKSPVICDGELVLPESGAIIEYLTERYGDGKFSPARESDAYARYLYWLHYAEGSVMFPILLMFYVNRFGDDVMAPVRDRAFGQLTLHFEYIDEELGKAPYFLGQEFSAADVQMSFPLEMMASLGLMATRYPNITDFLARIHSRPAYKSALEKGGAYDMAGVTKHPLPKT